MRYLTDRSGPGRSGPTSSTTAPGRDRDGTHGVPGKATLVGTAPTAALPPRLQATLETALAADLSAVRVGEDPAVAAIGARAHAHGIHVLFGPGAYQPDTAAGQALIAHEVIHLVQQADRPVAASGHVGGMPVNTEPGLEREADELGARALRGEVVRTAGASPGPSTGPIQGMFEDLGQLAHLFDPVVDAASKWWEAVTDHDDEPGHPANLDAGGGAKSKGKGKAPDPVAPEDPRPAPDLPDTDDAWQDVMADARASVQVTENYTVATRALNPDLLFAIRTAPVDHRDEFYDVLTRKTEKTKGKDASDLTPGRLAYRLGDELEAQAAAATALPGMLASKQAVLDKAAPAGTLDIAKSAGGTLRTKLGKGLSEPARASIDAWIKSRYQGNRLILGAAELTELRTVVTGAVAATARDPARDARIEQLRADIAACEVRVRAVLRAKAIDTQAAARRALWTLLAELAETAGVFVDRTLSSYTIEAEDGSQTTLDPALAISVNYLNPGGFKNGGGKYADATIDSVLAEVYAGDPDQADRTSATKKFIHTLNRNEGGPASMNTWDGEIVTAGPGLSGSGRLQKSMFEYKADDPGGFHDALGKFGVDIRRSGKHANPYFTVRVPIDVQAIPPAQRDVVTPGEVIIGSAKTGAKKSSDAYEECAALRYISKDPLLLSRFMYAGEHSYQRFLLKEAAKSMQQAGAFSFLIDDGTPGGRRVGWHALIEPLGAEWLAATEAVIAYRYHASSSTYEALKVKAAGFYRDRFGADRDPDELTDDERKQIGRFVAGQLKSSKYAVYRAQFPSVAADVFPPGATQGGSVADDEVAEVAAAGGGADEP
jgi:uncharacterized protein DUF4157